MNEIGRALRLRCPNCGKGRLLHTWLHLNHACDSCGLLFDRGEHDYFIGAYTINLIVAELVVVGAILAGMILWWPDVPWNALMWGLLPLALLVPIGTLPFARALWLGIDLRFRPPEARDFASS